MASAQVQHDGRVIGSLVAPCFSTLRDAASRCTRSTRTYPLQGVTSAASVRETGHRFMRSPGGCHAGTDQGSRCTWRFTSSFLRTAIDSLFNQYS